MAGLWSHKDLLTGAYTLEDLLDIHELLDLREENQNRAREYSKNNR